MRKLNASAVVPGASGVTAVEVAVREAIAGGPIVMPVNRGAAEYGVDVDGIRASLGVGCGGPSDLDDLVAIIATSGSSGSPRGVAITRRNMIVATGAVHHLLGGPGHWVVALPVTAIGGFMCVVRPTVAGTRTFVDPDVAGHARFGTHFGEVVQRARDSVGHDRLYVSLVPTQLRRILASDPDVLLLVDAVLLGGSAADPEDVATARAHGINVLESYGMTETCGGAAYDGVPLRGVDIHTDAPDRQSLGRLVVSGPTVAATYVPDAHEDLRAPVFRTSDLGTVGVDGMVAVLGRFDDVVISGGVNVSPRAVEAVVRELDARADPVAVGVADPEWGRVLVLFVDERTGVASDAITTAIRLRLGAPAVPKQIVRTSIPLLPNGKPDLAALRSLVDT